MKKLDIDEQRVLDLYEEHETARVVAEIMGCSNESVYRILRKYGVPRTHRHPKKRGEPMRTGCKTKYCDALIVMLRRHTSMNFSEIVKFTGYPTSVVANVTARRCPDTKVVRSHKEDFNIEQMVHEYRDLGMTSYELGDKYGVLPSTVRRWMRSEGVCKGKDNGISQVKSHEAAVERFVDSYPESLSRCNTWRDRAYVRRKNRILSRPHDKGCDGIKWWDIAKRNDGDLTCWICGGECVPGSRGDDAPSVDHLVPISNGGSDTFDNVRIAHRGCNRDRGNRVQLTFDYLTYEEANVNA